MSRINNLSAVYGDNMLVPVEHNEEHLAQKEMEFDKEDESVFLASTEELMFGWNLEREKRKQKDNRKIVATIDHIRKLAPMSRIQAEIMVKSIKEAFQEKELIIEVREYAWKSAVDKLSTYRTIYEHGASQRDEELEETRTRNSSLESKVRSFQTRIAELESAICRSHNEFGKVCEEFNIRSSDELLQALSQKMIIELKHTETLLELQELRTKNEQLRKASREAVRKLKELELTTKMVSKEKKEVERQFKLPLDQAGQNTMVLGEQKHGLVTPITHFLSTTVCQLDEKGKTRLQLCNSGNAPIILNKGAKVAIGELKELNVLTEKGKVEEVLEMWIEAGASDIDDKGVLCVSGSIDRQLTQVQSMKGEVEEVLEMWIEAGASDIDDKGVLCASGSIDLKLTQLQNTEIEKVITEKTRDQTLWKQVERDKPIVAGDTRKLISEHKDVLVISNDELGQTNLTKYAIAVPLPDKKAQTVEQAFIERCGLEERRLPTKLLKGKEKDLEISQFQKPKILHIKQCPTKGDTSRINGRDSKHPIIMEGEDAVGILCPDLDKNAKVLTQKLLKAQRFAKNHAERVWEGNKCWYVKKGKEKTRKFPIMGKRVPVQSTTTSPTALHRSNMILMQNLYLVENLAAVRLFALPPPLFVSHPVTEELCKALARCSSILSTLKNTKLMRKLEVIYFMPLNDSVGVYVFDDTRTLLILMPGIIMEPLRLDVFFRSNIAFEVEKIPWWIHKHRRKVFNQLPAIDNVIVVSAPCHCIIWKKEADYAPCVKKLERKVEGFVQVVKRGFSWTGSCAHTFAGKASQQRRRHSNLHYLRQFSHPKHRKKKNGAHGTVQEEIECEGFHLLIMMSPCNHPFHNYS